MIDAKFGSYVEMAYEISWTEARDLLEILEIRKELERRDRIKQRAQSL